MEIVYCKSTVKVYRYSLSKMSTLNVEALGYLDGITVYFGGFDGSKVNIMFEKMTGARCCDEQVFSSSLTVEERVEALERILLDNIQRYGCSFYEVREEWLRQYRDKLPKNSIPLWKTNFLIGF